MNISVYKGEPVQRGSRVGGLLKPLAKVLLPIAGGFAVDAISKRFKRFGQRKGGITKTNAESVAPTVIKSAGAVTGDVVRGVDVKTALKKRGADAISREVKRFKRQQKRTVETFTPPIIKTTNIVTRKKKQKGVPGQKLAKKKLNREELMLKRSIERSQRRRGVKKKKRDVFDTL